MLHTAYTMSWRKGIQLSQLSNISLKLSQLFSAKSWLTLSHQLFLPPHNSSFLTEDTHTHPFNIYTPWVKKTRHQALSHNFTNYYPILKIFSLKDSVVNLQQTLFKNSTTLETCRYTTLWNMNVTKWHHSEICTIRYDTRCYFNVRSKANISQLNLPHGTDN